MKRNEKENHLEYLHEILQICGRMCGAERVCV